MIQKIARERSITAAEAAKRFGKSPRTIRRLVAQDREDYEHQALKRRQQAHALYAQGMSWAEVGQAMNCSPEAAKQLGKRFRAMQEASSSV